MARQIKCENGHYYDSNLEKCPYCIGTINSTVLIDLANNKSPRNISGNKKKDLSSVKDNETVLVSSKNSIDNRQEKEKEESIIVLAGWLVVISNKHKGQSYEITFGFNTIGRALNNHIALEFDKSISRDKHASIVYDYSNNKFFLKHEDGKYLTYLNDEVVLDIKELKSFDKIKIGNTTLLFIALCSEKFKWED